MNWVFVLKVSLTSFGTLLYGTTSPGVWAGQELVAVEEWGDEMLKHSTPG